MSRKIIIIIELFRFSLNTETTSSIGSNTVGCSATGASATCSYHRSRSIKNSTNSNYVCLLIKYLAYSQISIKMTFHCLNAIHFRLPALPNSANSEPRVLEIQVPASALQENKLHSALTATPIIQSIMSLPPAVAASVLQQHINAVLANSGTSIAKQLDGTADTSDEDGSDVSDDNLDNDDDDDNMQVCDANRTSIEC